MDEAIALEGEHGTAQVHPIGATVLSWIPRGGDDVLWVAPGARFEEGRAIRGGIPLCWPWFADAGTPGHGLLRKRRWDLIRHDHVDGDAIAEWGLEHDDGDWVFSVRYRVRVGRELTVELIHEDRSGRARAVGGALHTYLRLNPARAQVHGLDSVGFDKLTQQDRRVQGPTGLTGPLDLVVPHRGPVTVELGDRTLRVEGRNHCDVVLWNPGTAQVSDLAPGDEQAFACVETAIVSAPVEVAAGGQFTLGLRLCRG